MGLQWNKVVVRDEVRDDRGQIIQSFIDHGKDFGFYSKGNKNFE